MAFFGFTTPSKSVKLLLNPSNQGVHLGVLPEILFRYPQFKAMQKLTATAVKQAKPKAKPYKLADGGGLYLHVKTAG